MLITTLLLLTTLLPYYIIGAFPSGQLIAKLNGVNLESEGSGNVGATNVARVLGKKSGAAVLLIDILKGFLALTVASAVCAEPGYLTWAALFTVMGHCFSTPSFLSDAPRKGGKGVATTLGTLLYLSPPIALMGVIIFAVVFKFSGIVSLGSIAAAFSLPVIAVLLKLTSAVIIPLASISVLIVYRHKENILRLAAGTEKRFRTN